MEKLKAAASRIAKAIGLTQAALRIAQGRYEKQHRRARKRWDKHIELGKEADRLRRQGKPKKAAAKDAAALRQQALSEKASKAARVRLGQAKRLNQKLKGLEHAEEEIEEKLRKLEGKVKIEGNKVTGGSPEARLQAAILRSIKNCSQGIRPNFYSQPGRFSVDYALTGEPRGYRSDCSQWVSSIYKAAGLPDPHGTGYTWGWTGTLANEGRAVSREYARTHPGTAVLWPGHVELSLGDGTERTGGHGSAPIDLGTFDLLPGPQFRAYDLN